jgi:hypothetical protein
MGVYNPVSAANQFTLFNLADGETLIGALKRYSAMVNMDHKIFGNALQGFATILFSNTHTFSQLNAQPLVPYLLDPWVSPNVYGFSGYPPPAGVSSVPTSVSGNPFSTTYMDQGAAGALIPESGPGYGNGSGLEVLLRDRYTNYPRQYISDSNFFRGVGGLKGDISDDLHWEAAADINRYVLNYTNPGLWDTNALNAAWADGQLARSTPSTSSSTARPWSCPPARSASRSASTTSASRSPPSRTSTAFRTPLARPRAGPTRRRSSSSRPCAPSRRASPR